MYIVAERLTDWLIKNGTISQQSKDNYIYGIEVTMEKLISYSVLFILAVFLKILIPSILFFLFFIVLRGYTGGYHAKTFMGCFISSIFLYLGCSQLMVPFFISESKYVIPVTIVSCIIILILAPMNHPNLNLNHKELRSCKIGTRIVLMIEVIFVVFGIKSGINTVYIVFPFLGTFICAVLLIVAKLIRQEVAGDEE